MARNRMQFQKSLSKACVATLYGNEGRVAARQRTLPLTEADPLAPLSGYAVQKLQPISRWSVGCRKPQNHPILQFRPH